ncbi:hypothetical protein [Streptococcus hyovaginalis]|uniref:hypothetical protein n=1 Tax=Streptococcus hyovaginalis TaxID=149015 RepID=UPI0014788F40|nr:hypothetical protein [Streptococcus hyovaginalis]
MLRLKKVTQFLYPKNNESPFVEGSHFSTDAAITDLLSPNQCNTIIKAMYHQIEETL